MAAERIRYSNDPASVTIFNAGDPFTELTGPAAVAFVRFLHYLGIFELEAAKKPCPECGEKPPQDCDTCGGLGWVI